MSDLFDAVLEAHGGGGVQRRVGQIQPGSLRQDRRLDACHLLGEPDVFRRLTHLRAR